VKFGNWKSIGRALIAACVVAFVAAIVLGRTAFRSETDHQFEELLSAHPIMIPGIMILALTVTALADLRKALDGQVLYFYWLVIVFGAIGYSIYLFVEGIKNAF